MGPERREEGSEESGGEGSEESGEEGGEENGSGEKGGEKREPRKSEPREARGGKGWWVEFRRKKGARIGTGRDGAS